MRHFTPLRTRQRLSWWPCLHTARRELEMVVRQQWDSLMESATGSATGSRTRQPSLCKERLARTSMESDEDPDHCFLKAKRTCNRLAAVEEPVTDHHFTQYHRPRASGDLSRHKAQDLHGSRLRSGKHPGYNEAPSPERLIKGQKDREDCWSWHAYDNSIRQQLFRLLPQLQDEGPLDERQRCAWQRVRKTQKKCCCCCYCCRCKPYQDWRRRWSWAKVVL